MLIFLFRFRLTFLKQEGLAAQQDLADLTGVAEHACVRTDLPVEAGWGVWAGHGEWAGLGVEVQAFWVPDAQLDFLLTRRVVDLKMINYIKFRAVLHLIRLNKNKI